MPLIGGRCKICNASMEFKKEFGPTQFEVSVQKGEPFRISEFHNYFKIELRIPKKPEWHMFEFEVKKKVQIDERV